MDCLNGDEGGFHESDVIEGYATKDVKYREVPAKCMSVMLTWPISGSEFPLTLMGVLPEVNKVPEPANLVRRKF